MPAGSKNPNISSVKRIARGRLRGQWQKAFVPAFIITLLTGVPALFSSLSQSMLWMNLMMDDSWLNASDTTQMMDIISRFQLTGPAALLENLLSLFSFVCGGALAVSLASLALKIIRQEDYSSSEAFSGFSQFLQAFIVSLLIMVFTVLWALITIVPGIIVLSVGAYIGTAAMAILGIIIFICTIILFILIIIRYSMAYYIASDDPSLPASHVTAASVFMMRGRSGNFLLFELSFIGWLILASLPITIGVSLISAGYLEGMSALTFIGAVISLAAMIPLALVSLYIATSEAVYYSTISGNYNVSVSAGQDGYYVSPAGPDSSGDPASVLSAPAGHEDYPEELSSGDPYAQLTEEPDGPDGIGKTEPGSTDSYDPDDI